MSRNYTETKMKRSKAKRSSRGQDRSSNKAREGKSYESNFKDELKSETNDPAWYTQDDALVRDACSIPFTWRAGSKVIDNMSDVLACPTSIDYNDWNGVIPGICAIEVAPAVGYSTSPEDPVNIASTAMYSFVRHVNSGHKNYDATDLMMYNLAMSSVYSCLNWLQRLYGIAMFYSQYNMYLPAQLIRANGVDPVDLQNNLSNFRYSLNVLINKAASLAVPSNLPIFKRHAFLFQNVYIEGASPKDQMYMYIPYGFFKRKFDVTAKMNKLELVKTPIRQKSGTRYCDPLMKVSEILKYAQDLVDSVYADEDCGIISGDILKAYGLEHIIKLTPVDANYVVAPIVDIAVLEQMKNATCFHDLQNADVVEVIPKDTTSPYLKYTPSIPGGVPFDPKVSGFDPAKVYRANRLLITSSINPTPAIVLENTRLMSAVSGNKDTTEILCGSEIAVAFYTWDGLYDSSCSEHSFFMCIDAIAGSKNPTIHGHYFTSLASFKFHPQQVVFEVSVSPSATSKRCVAHNGYNIDFDNFTLLTPDMLRRIHETALLSEFNVPLIGRVQ